MLRLSDNYDGYLEIGAFGDQKFGYLQKCLPVPSGAVGSMMQTPLLQERYAQNCVARSPSGTLCAYA
jgi:hypothetical protein